MDPVLDPGTLQLRAIECDPAIITLPGATTEPLPPPGTVAYGGMPETLMHTVNPPNAAIAPPAEYPGGWDDPGAQELQPAWPPDDQPREAPWWQRNQPPDQQP